MTPHNINPILFFSLLLFFACEEPAEVRQMTEPGKVTFVAKEDPRKPVKLTNVTARTTENHISGPFLDILQDGKAVKEDMLVDETESVELDPGNYTAILQTIDEREDHKGKVHAEGEQEFTVEAGKTKQVHITMYYNVMSINVHLKNLDGATIWVGDKGFEPSDEHVWPQWGKEFYAEGDEFDIVVEFEGERKRYTAESNLGYEYSIIITREEEEEEEEEEPVGGGDEGDKGTTTFSYEIYRAYEPTMLTFNW